MSVEQRLSRLERSHRDPETCYRIAYAQPTTLDAEPHHAHLDALDGLRFQRESTETWQHMIRRMKSAANISKLLVVHPIYPEEQHA